MRAMFWRPLQMRARAIDALSVRHVGDVQIGRPRARRYGSCLDDHAAPHILDAGRIGELDVMDPAVHPVDDQIDLLAHLVAGKPLADDAADDRLGQLTPMEKILADAARLGEALGGQRPVHRPDDVVPLAKLLQGRLGPLRDDPAARIDLGRKAVALQALRAADQELAVLADEIGAFRARPEIDEALVPLPGDQHLIEPRQPLGLHLARELAGDFDVALMPKLQRD